MRFPPHGPGGFGLLGGIFTDILAGLVFIILFIVAVGLLFVLVRFLLVATKAAELYVAKNGTTQDNAPATAPAPTPAVATKPVARSREPKTPPTT
jgi:hypothetical protein